MDSIWTNGSWQVVTTSNDFLFHYFILSISLSFVLSYSSNGTQFISLSSIIDKVQRKGGPLIKNRLFQTTMLADAGLRFSFQKRNPPVIMLKGQEFRIILAFASLFTIKNRRGWPVVVLTMFVQSSSILLFLNLRRGRRQTWDLWTEQHNKDDEMKKKEREASEEGLTNYLLVFG